MNKLKILVVEDSRIAQKMVLFVLTKMQYQVDVADTGNAAINLAQKNKYDIILMDVGLDDMTGCAASENIRRSGMSVSAWIIALTAHNDVDTRKSCMEAGMDGFVIKPFTKEKFQTVLKELKKPK
jgi:CheY-like chemotaxis protein